MATGGAVHSLILRDVLYIPQASSNVVGASLLEDFSQCRLRGYGEISNPETGVTLLLVAIDSVTPEPDSAAGWQGQLPSRQHTVTSFAHSTLFENPYDKAERRCLYGNYHSEKQFFSDSG